MYLSDSKNIPVVGSYDVIVCGGGPSGIIAATAAARNGANTLLIERYGFVGGMATSALVTPISEFRKNGRQIIGGIPFELMERLSDMGGADISLESGNYPVNDELFKLAAQRLLLESGVTLLYHTYFSDCIEEGGFVSHVIVQNKAGRTAYECKAVIDCTGDADLVRAAGFQTYKNDFLQPATLWFQLCGVDMDLLEEIFGDATQGLLPVSALIRARLSELNEKGIMPLFGGPWIRKNFHDGMVTINLLREATDASSPEQFTRTECNMRENLERVIEVLRDNFPAFKNCWLAKSGTQTGVRETYHIEGLYKMKSEDVLTPKPFADTIAKGAHVVDIHHHDSIEQEHLNLDREYNISYGILVPVGSKNVITAGRCICADEDAFGTIRVIAPCMAMGQAAGTAAAICVQKGYLMSEMNIPLLRAMLIEQGAIIDIDDPEQFCHQFSRGQEYERTEIKI